ncbi:MAG: hypothetical protein ACM3IH_17765 [Sphingobacteriales bacterium]
MRSCLLATGVVLLLLIVEISPAGRALVGRGAAGESRAGLADHWRSDAMFTAEDERAWLSAGFLMTPRQYLERAAVLRADGNAYLAIQYDNMGIIAKSWLRERRGAK